MVYCKSWYENFINRAMPWLTPINNLFQVSGIYLIMAVSIDRLVIVRKQVKPTKSNRRRRKLFTWFVIFTIFLFSFIFTLPNWFLYESTAIQINITQRDIGLNRFVIFLLVFSYLTFLPLTISRYSKNKITFFHNSEKKN